MVLSRAVGASERLKAKEVLYVMYLLVQAVAWRKAISPRAGEEDCISSNISLKVFKHAELEVHLLGKSLPVC